MQPERVESSTTVTTQTQEFYVSPYVRDKLFLQLVINDPDLGKGCS